MLVLQREDDPTFWQSVTGSLESNEVPIQTAQREVLEETGIDAAALNLIIADCRLVNQYTIREHWRFRYAKGVTSNFEYVFCLQIPSNANITLSEHINYLWLDKSQAINKVWSPTNKLAIAECVPNVKLSHKPHTLKDGKARQSRVNSHSAKQDANSPCK